MLCTSIEAHVATIKTACSYTPGYYHITKGSCGTDLTSNFKITDANLCERWNSRKVEDFDGHGYCPDGANGTTCACKKGTNWKTADQKCQTSR